MWAITFEQRVHREDELTVGQAERLEVMLGETWFTIVPLRSAKHARAILTVMHATATGEPEDVVEARVKSLTVNAFTKLVTSVEEDLPTLYVDGNPPQAGEG